MRVFSFITLGMLVLPISGCKFGKTSTDSEVREASPTSAVAGLAEANEALRIIGANIEEVRLAAADGHEPYCAQSCHWHGSALAGATAAKVQDWGRKTQEFSACLNSFATKPNFRFLCLLEDPTNEASAISPSRLGFYRAGVFGSDGDLFKDIFMTADEKIIKSVYSADFPAIASGTAITPEFRTARLTSFLADAEMPPRAMAPGVVPLAAGDYAKAKAWLSGPMDNLTAAFAVGADHDGPTVCLTEYQNPEFFFGTPGGAAGFYKETKTYNWQQKLLVTNNKRVEMFGCPHRRIPTDAIGAGALQCLAGKNAAGTADQFPEVESAGLAWPERQQGNGLLLKQKMRILKKFNDCRSTYWVRSSADGRFFAGGLRDNAGGCAPADSMGFIFDLANPKRKIGVNAPYDPGFFPDNEGFTFISADGGVMCDQRVLEANPSHDLNLDLNDRKICGQSTMGVYQHVGRGLEPTDSYLTVRSDNYQNDDGAYSEMVDPEVSPFANKTNNLEVWPFRKGDPGIGESPFEVAKTPTNISVDYNGDFSISPSGRLVMARIGGNVNGVPTHLGYQLSMLDLEGKQYKKLASVCMLGGKAELNFTERFMAVHHYPNDTDREDLSNPNLATEAERNAAFEKLVHRKESSDPETKGSSNIYVYDIVNQQKIRLTRMGPGQYALYPHFRADGWLYFVVRDTNTSIDYAMATDAVIRLEDPALVSRVPVSTKR